jgi:hypothetical protein
MEQGHRLRLRQKLIDSKRWGSPLAHILALQHAGTFIGNKVALILHSTSCEPYFYSV